MTDNIKNRRKPLLAFLLSILTPGLGHIYNGRFWTGVILYLVCLIFLPFIYSWTHLTSSFIGLASMLIIEVSFRIFIIVSAIYISYRIKDYTPKSFNKPTIMIMIAALMLLIPIGFNKINSLGMQTYRIPTSSNVPTLQVNDIVVSDITSYKKNSIQYGDIVAFKNHVNETWVSRVVGLPFDTISVVDNVVSINHKICQTTFIKDDISDEVSVKEFEEVLPNGHRHKIFMFATLKKSPKNNVSDTIIPANHYYLMGDNRDNSADSRFHGFVNKEKITGRIIYSYWGKTKDRININFKDK